MKTTITVFFFANFVFLSNTWACFDMGIMSSENKTRAIYKYLADQPELNTNFFLTVYQIKLNIDDTAEVSLIEDNDLSTLILKKFKIDGNDNCGHTIEEVN